MGTYTYKRITDADGIEYEEVDHDTYLSCTNRQRIIQHLESRYFVEVDAKLNKGEQK